MEPVWRAVPERSSRFWLWTITWIALRMGRSTARWLLYPITAYFMLFRNRTSEASRVYLRRVLGRPPTLRDRFLHYHTFACTLLDRILMLAGREDQFDVRVHGLDVLMDRVSAGQSCLLVGSHLGSFEMIRAIGKSWGGLRIKALVDGETTPVIAGFLRKLNPELHEDIIYVGRAASLVGLERYSSEGALLALLGDRTVHGDRRVLCEFLSAPAYFPQAPALLGQILHLPLVFFVCLHRGWGRYEVHFEPLAESGTVSRERRDAAVAEIMQRYAARVDHYCRLAPYNWFNFYDFWRRDD